MLEAGAHAGLGLRVHANQLGLGPGVRLAVELGAASVDHCTYLTDADVEALAGSDTVATLLPATDFSTRQPYPDAPATARRRRHGGARHQLQSRLELHDLDELLHRARRPRDADDGRGGAAAPPPSAAPRRCGAPTSGISRPGRAADAVVLAAPSYAHLVYRPGVPLDRRDRGRGAGGVGGSRVGARAAYLIAWRSPAAGVEPQTHLRLLLRLNHSASGCSSTFGGISR